MFVQILLVCVLFVLLIAYSKGQWNEWYWKKRGVKFHSRNKLFGPFWDFLTQDKALFQAFGDIHRLHGDEPVVGIGSVFGPMLIAIDENIINHVFQSDFQSFYHRGVESHPGDKLADSMTFANGNRWKLMRQSMTPLFTSKKLKSMYYIMDKSARDFIKFLEDNPEVLNGDAFSTMSTFCSAAITASVFGITTESVFDSPFLKMATESFPSTFWSDFRFSIFSSSSWVFKMLGLTLFGEHEDFFIDAIKKTIRQREIDNVKKHDFADLCVSLQKSGELKDPDTGFTLQPTDEMLAAHGFFFYIGGVETSAASLYWALLELGLNHNIMKRVQEEIDAAFQKENGQMSYDTIEEMKYVDMVLSESLRKYPPVGVLMRQCVQDTVLPVINLKIEKGTKIAISTYENHNDPKRYPDPESFIPERFETKDGTELFIAFGKGPRNCIGARYARLQVKTGLVYFLRHYTVKTIIDGDRIRFKKNPFQVRPANVDVRFATRKSINCP